MIGLYLLIGVIVGGAVHKLAPIENPERTGLAVVSIALWPSVLVGAVVISSLVKAGA